MRDMSHFSLLPPGSVTSHAELEIARIYLRPDEMGGSKSIYLTPSLDVFSPSTHVEICTWKLGGSNVFGGFPEVEKTWRGRRRQLLLRLLLSHHRDRHYCTRQQTNPTSSPYPSIAFVPSHMADIFLGICGAEGRWSCVIVVVLSSSLLLLRRGVLAWTWNLDKLLFASWFRIES